MSDVKSLIKNKFYLAIFTFSSLNTYGMDLDSGDYIAAPAGTNIALFYLQYAKRNSLYDSDNKSPGSYGLESEIGILRFAHFTELFSYITAPQVIIPFGQLKASKDIAKYGDSSGLLGDIIFASPTWLINDSVEGRYWGISPYLTIPTGHYSKDKTLNIGENRYKLTLQTSYLKIFDNKIGLDISGDITFYGKNDDYQESYLKQDLGYQLQTSTFYKVNNSFDLRTGLSYSDLGKTKDKSISFDSTKQSKFWVGSAINLSKKSNLIFTYGKDIKVENGFKEKDRVNFRFMYAY